MVNRRTKLLLTIAGGVLILCGALSLFLNQIALALAFGVVGVIVRVLGYVLPLTPFHSISQRLFCPSCGTLHSAISDTNQSFSCPLCAYSY
jgi:rubredoxin